MLQLRFFREGYYLPLLTSILLIASFPRADLGFLGWFALLPLFLYCLKKQDSWKLCFLGGLLAGFPFFVYLFAYMAIAVNFVMPPVHGYLVVILASFYSSLFFAVFSAVLCFFFKKGKALSFTLGGPSLWVLLEWLRSMGLFGHTGGFLGYSQVNYVFLLQSVSLYGYWGLAFLMVLFQTIVFLIWQKLVRRELVLPCAVFLFFFICGMVVPSFFTVTERDEPLYTALFQGNIPQEEVMDYSMSLRNFDHYIILGERAAAEWAATARTGAEVKGGRLDLMVWPETVLTTTANYAAARNKLDSLSDQSGAAILFGAVYFDKSTGDFYNSIFLQPSNVLKDREAQGQAAFWELSRYDKIRLVPLAEYAPFADLLNDLLNLEIPLGTYSPGNDTPVYWLGDDVVIGGIVCFESYFPQPALSLAKLGAEHIFVLSNNAWFRESIGLDQHVRMAAIRAVETGVGVTQVANTGSTVSFDFRGQEVLSMPIGEEGFAVLESTFPCRRTLYRTLGDYFLIICFGFLMLSIPRQIFPQYQNNEIE